MNILLILMSVSYSLIALIIVYFIVTKKMKKIFIFFAIYLEIIVILCIALKKPGLSGLGVIPFLCYYIVYIIKNHNHK
ncbi:MAG: hypothetical protein RSE93_03745 [Oscillospiraceae bacterium]